MPKMSKAQARKRLNEAQNKVIAVVVQGAHHLSPADTKKLYTIRQEIMKIAMKLR